MKLKNIAAGLLLATSIPAVANDSISYDWFELNAGYQDASFGGFTTLGLTGSYSLSDTVYVTGGIGHSTHSSVNAAKATAFGANLGYHAPLNGSTDFYAELGLGYIDPKVGDGNTTYDVVVGTRTIFSDNIEVITDLGYFDGFDSDVDGAFSLGVSGLYKFNENQAVRVGASVTDGDLGGEVGFRYNF